MLKTSAYFLLTIIFLACPAIAQNSNTAANAVQSGPLSIEMPPIPPANSTMRGRVYYEDTGRPVKRASIMFVSSDSGGAGEKSGLTDGEGNFLIKNVPAGTYYAVINAPGVVSPIAYIDFSRFGPGGGGNDREALEQALVDFDKIIVDGVNETYVQVRAKHGGAISGRVIYANGDPAVGAKVEILRKVNGKFVSVVSSLASIMSMFSGSGSSSGQTDDRGMYRFPGLPPGEYVVKVSESVRHAENDERRGGPGDAFAMLLFGSTNSLLNFYFPDATDLKDAQVLNVLLGQEQGEVNITIPDKSLFTLTGKVIARKDKKTLAGVRIALQKKGQTDSSLFNMMGREMNSAVTDGEGNWKFKDLPQGEYSITVTSDNSHREYDSDDDDPDVGVTAKKIPPPVKFAKAFKDVLIEDKNLEDVIIELGYGAVVSGTVSVEGNKAMPMNVTIQAMGEHEENLSSATVFNYEGSVSANRAMPSIPQKTNNEFKLENVAAGKITLKFNINEDSYYVKSARSGMTDLLAGPVDVKEGEMLSGVKIVLAKDTGTLKGKILDDRDQPASGVALLVLPTDSAKRSSNFFKNARSDGEGKFEMKLPPGEYAILFVKAGITSGDPIAFKAWLDEEMKSPYKVSISAEGTANAALRKPNP
ncbi:MAG TPA: carboxypeptidase regulatory-like domain-containing protein [Pyrinomonadaceae bacterium]|jgi:hypothetical protein|nr:carboxypeptidase regulatory-like domain-containing protein [Pyrinomonadaceae bacterium]